MANDEIHDDHPAGPTPGTDTPADPGEQHVDDTDTPADPGEQHVDDTDTPATTTEEKKADRSLRTALLIIAASILCIVAGAALSRSIPSPGFAPVTPRPSSTPSASAPRVSPAASAGVDRSKLGTALDQLFYRGAYIHPTEVRDCFAAVVGQSTMTTPSILILQSGTSATLLDAVSRLRLETSQADATILGSEELRQQLAVCAAEAPSTATSSTQAAPKDLTPVFRIAPDAQITTAGQLRPGLVSMFSVPGNPDQIGLITAHADCLTTVVLQGGLSQESLRFIAGGARIGLGSVQQYLPSTADAGTWNSAGFSTAMAACTSSN